MAHFAEVKDGIVQRVIVADQEFIDSGLVGDPSVWVMSSTDDNGLEPVKKNAAGPGFTFDVARDAFISPKPFDSFVLNEEKCVYEAPVEKPKDGKEYRWKEETLSWEVASTESSDLNPV